MVLNITRGISAGIQTLGIIELVSNCKIVAAAVTLELPYIANKTSVSCIKTGIYRAVKYNSPSNGKCILFKDVEGRSMIELHAGNFYTDIEGCVLIGKYFTDLDHDGIVDVAESRNTLNKLLTLLPDEFLINIQ